jgi:anti-sigma B factor antagonist
MDFQSRVVNDVTIISGTGRLNMLSGPGLRALIGSLKATREAGGDLRIAAPTAQVSMVLELSNIDRILPPHATADGAFDE